MSQTLIIFFPDGTCEPDTEVNWLLVDSSDRVTASDRTAINRLYAVLQTYTGDFSVIALAPAEAVLSARVEIPSTQLRQIRQALPYMVEELIADDIDNVHTAIAANYRATLPEVQTVVVSHRQLIQWLDVLHSHQLSPDAILVDALCLPHEQQGWTLLVDGDRLLIRRDLNIGMAIQRDDVPLVLAPLLNQLQQNFIAGAIENPVRPQLHVIASDDTASDGEAADALVDYLQREFPDFAVKSSRFREPVTELICQDWREQKIAGINLLQGGYAVRRGGGDSQGAWGLVATIAGIGFAIYGLLALAGGWYFDHRAAQLEQQSVTIYRQLFPLERRVVNPRKQLQNHLQQQTGGSNSAFLALLAETAGQMQDDPSATAVAVNQLRYNDQQGDLRIEVNSQSLEQLDQFKNRLTAGGLKVDISSASEQSGGVIGRIVVSQL